MQIPEIALDVVHIRRYSFKFKKDHIRLSIDKPFAEVNDNTFFFYRGKRLLKIRGDGLRLKLPE